VQYTSASFRAALSANDITASMSARGNCYDNARAEAFFSTLKMELVYRQGEFEDHAQARRQIVEWIEAFYNRRRRHSSIGNLSPIDFENQKTESHHSTPQVHFSVPRCFQWVAGRSSLPAVK
jgi:putative transposase